MSDSHDNSPAPSHTGEDVTALEAMGAMPDRTSSGIVLIVLIGALGLMTATIIFSVPLVLKVGWGMKNDAQANRAYPQITELRAMETEALGTAKKLENGLFRMPIADGKAALLANPGLLASAGEGAAKAPAPAADGAEAAPAMSDEELAAKGKSLFNGGKICMSCHKADSTDRLVGPGLKGLFGRATKLADGTELTADEAYVRESLKEPNAKVVEGYPPAMTPQSFTDVELDALIAYLKTL
ncbi:MAG: cytochrome c [Deltaproteobacteria bacterium]|nr:cytochrome c [Deltaproteobacteria bacterium]